MKTEKAPGPKDFTVLQRRSKILSEKKPSAKMQAIHLGTQE